MLRRLKTLGVRIAMDDFGTGYSSLPYLQAFPFDKIKIDQAFIANLDRNPQSAAIIRASLGSAAGSICRSSPKASRPNSNSPSSRAKNAMKSRAS